MPSLPDRPAALTPEVQAKIIEAMALGSYYTTACRAAGVTPQAVDYWKKLFDAGVEHAKEYADFFGALARASSVAEVDALRDVRSGRTGWQGPAWFLERRFPKRWNAKTRAAVSERPEAEPPAVDEQGNNVEP